MGRMSDINEYKGAIVPVFDASSYDSENVIIDGGKMHGNTNSGE